MTSSAIKRDERAKAVGCRRREPVCLFCGLPRPPLTLDQATTDTNPKRHDSAAPNVVVEAPSDETTWVCDDCASKEPDPTSPADGCSKQNSHCQKLPCACHSCLERRDLEADQQRELQSLQKCWMQLRHSVRLMYRDGLNKELRTTKGKQFDAAKLKQLVVQLCERDAHQLYQRLESQGREYVMELKVNLLQMIVSPDKADDAADDGGRFTVDQSKAFLKATLDNFSTFQETVRNMQPFMQKLDQVHLEKFGISWKLVNHHLFDSVVYREPLIQSSLSAMSARLGVQLAASENDSEVKRVERANKNLPSAAIELAQSFRALDRLMATSMEIWEKASERMEEYTAKQMKLYKATLKAKQRMLKEDLEFFKQQRRLLENYVAKSKDCGDAASRVSDTHRLSAVDDARCSSSEEELTVFAETLRNLLTGGRPTRQHSASPIECARCRQRHCPCDECTISHLITCGLISEEDQELEIPPTLLDELPAFGELGFGESPYSSESSGAESDDGDSESDGDEFKLTVCATSPPRPRPVCRTTTTTLHKRTTIVLSDGQGNTKVHQDVSTCSVPSAVYTLHGQQPQQVALSPAPPPFTVAPLQTDAQQHLQRAYGDWQLPWGKGWLPGFSFERLRAGWGRKRPDECEGSDGGDRSTSAATQQPPDAVTTPPSKGASPSRQRTSSLPADEAAGARSQATAARSRVKTVAAASACKPKCKARIGDIPLDKIPPDFMKLMKDETLAKALTVAAASRGLLNLPTSGAGAKQAASWKDLENIDWKDVKIDKETLRKFYEQQTLEAGCTESKKSSNGSAVRSAASAEGKAWIGELANGTDAEELDDEDEEDEDDDSWSCDSSASQKDGKHCDCCYCEMFGMGSSFERGHYGRHDQIRERLRLKLKKKEEEGAAQQGEGSLHSSDTIEGHRGCQPLDQLLAYINGPDGENKEGGKSAKSAKRQRQKLRRAEEKQKRGRSRRLVDAAPPSPPSRSPDAVVRAPSLPPVEPKRAQSSSSSTPKKKPKKKGVNSPTFVDEVFHPRDDIDDLDEADRDVEKFKQFVLETKPQEHRAKVQLNLSSIFKNSKRAATTVV